jgi:hypothetical protein
MCVTLRYARRKPALRVSNKTGTSRNVIPSKARNLALAWPYQDPFDWAQGRLFADAQGDIVPRGFVRGSYSYSNSATTSLSRSGMGRPAGHFAMHSSHSTHADALTSSDS